MPRGGASSSSSRGPLFANLVLADQINRGMPKTQSALLQAMEGEYDQRGPRDVQSAAAVLCLGHAEPAGNGRHVSLARAGNRSLLLRNFWFRRQRCDEVEEIFSARPKASRHARSDRRWERLLEMRKLARVVLLPPDVRRLAVSLTMATHPDHPQAPDIVKRLVRHGAAAQAQTLALAAKIRGSRRSRPSVARRSAVGGLSCACGIA